MPSQNPIFIPGPTNIPDRIRRAMLVQTLDHRSSEFAALIQPILSDLKKVFKTRAGQVFIFPATGTGGWEAAITNTLSPGDTVLASSHGVFSDRWIDLCQKHNLNVKVIEAEWGLGAPAEKIANILQADRRRTIKAVLVTHNETATGVRSDVRAVGRAIADAGHPALLLCDCVSSLASMEFCMDEWGVDLAVTGSQKGFMLPAGLAILAASEKALAATHRSQLSRCFMDIRDMAQSNAKGAFPYTPPAQLLYGLRESLDMLLEEGLDAVYQRHFRIAEGVRRAVSAWGLQICARSPELRSDTVTAIVVPPGFNSDALTEHAHKAYEVSFGIGLGRLTGRAFRIGHLGSMTDVMSLAGLSAIEMAMKDLDYPVELGVGVAAAQEYYRQSRSTVRAFAA